MQELLEYGTFEENPAFWASIDPISYLDELSGPLQLHHGTTSELFLYENDNHNISNGFGTAMQRSVQFFDQYLKDTGGE